MHPLMIPKHLNKWNKQVTILYDPQKQNTNKNNEQSSYREEELPEMGLDLESACLAGSRKMELRDTTERNWERENGKWAKREPHKNQRNQRLNGGVATTSLRTVNPLSCTCYMWLSSQDVAILACPFLPCKSYKINKKIKLDLTRP